MATISTINQYKFRIKYLRKFVNHFDTNKGYNLRKLKYVESEEDTRRTRRSMAAFMATVPASELLNREQVFLINQYFNLVFPPKTFNDNFKELRRYTNGFKAKDGYDLRNVFKIRRPKLQKAVEVMKLISELTQRPHTVVKRFKGARLRAIQEAAQHTRFPKELKVAFVPVSDETPLKIKFTKKGLVEFIQNANLKVSSLFNMRALIENPDDEIARAFNRFPDTNYSTYNIMAGEHEVYKVQTGAGAPLVDSLKGITKKAIFYMNKYSSESYDPNDRNSSFYGNWLLGIVAYKSDTKAGLRNYITRVGQIHDIEKEKRKMIMREKSKKRRKAQKIIQTKTKTNRRRNKK